MSASSLSVAAAAIGTCSNCLFSPTSIDHHPSLYIFPFMAKPIKTPPKLKNCLNYSPVSPISRSSIHCASTAFDSVELSEDEVEEDPESGIEETVSKVEEEENDVSESADGGRLYVGNLPFSLTSAQLSEIFAEAGRVVSVEIVYDRVTDRSRGFAFVTMGTVDEAKEAIRLFDGSQIGGRTAKVNFPEVPRGGEREVMSPKIRSSYQGFVDSPYKIYAGNLSWNLTSQALREAFAEQPGFLSAKVIYERESGRSRGFGFITFSSAEEVDSALNALNGLELEGRPIRLNLAEQKAAASTPPPSDESASENNLENSEIFSSASA
ncbi:33 kDa ribonucleoprotein chloroplastic [Phtheirospermum japonicum]|uniref:33 kDa ribonucleoprotein chloroplastic n=1 Tax=Phtheirospermum japonicum TaxID=374723 RepID=A0A830CL81_9LAMI|nr:33 kDa ribonucleoprotein chloroplastic [Phtheirospermum japonicum]